MTPLTPKLQVTCDLIPPPQTSTLVFTDNCSAVGTPVFTETQSDPIDGVYTITRTWTVSDACGNVSPTYTQYLIVTQTAQETTITIPSNVEICNDEITATTDLANYLPIGTPTNGTWLNESNVGTLNGSVFSSFGVTAGSYTFSYTYDTATCPQKINIVAGVTICGIVEPCVSIEIHNAFTPNGDGLNEYFSIEHIEDFACYPTNKVEIYNRWGVLVYETKNYDNSSKRFEGISEGRATVAKSQELPTGTYFYIISWTTTDGQTVNKDGYLYLTR